MPATVNELLLDATVGHQVDLAHYSNGAVHRIIALLNRVDAELAAKLTQALESLPAGQGTVERIDALLLSVRELNARAYAAVGRELTEELRRLADYEAGHQLALFERVIPPQVQAAVGVARVSVEQAYAAAMARPFQGVLLREALAGLEAGRAKLIRDQVRIGFVSNETAPEIVRRLRGTRAKGYADGLLNVPRQHLESIVRTAVSHTAGVVRDNFTEANRDLIKALSWSATLDARTSNPCRLRDGKRYTPGDHKPIGHSLPWGQGPGRFHWCCRSVSVPVVKSWRDLGIDLPDLAPGQRASMDGAVPADLSYGEWLKKQSAARQDQVLGPTRGALLRRGGLSIEDFSNDKGVMLTLDELRARDAEAFRKAGV